MKRIAGRTFDQREPQPSGRFIFPRFVVRPPCDFCLFLSLTRASRVHAGLGRRQRKRFRSASAVIPLLGRDRRDADPRSSLPRSYSFVVAIGDARTEENSKRRLFRAERKSHRAPRERSRRIARARARERSILYALCTFTPFSPAVPHTSDRIRVWVKKRSLESFIFCFRFQVSQTSKELTAHGRRVNNRRTYFHRWFPRTRGGSIIVRCSRDNAAVAGEYNASATLVDNALERIKANSSNPIANSSTYASLMTVIERNL